MMNAAHEPTAPPPIAAINAATSAPTLKGASTKVVVSISPMPNATATRIQITRASICPRAYRRGQAMSGATDGISAQQRAGELVGVERAQVLELLADADQLDRDAQLACDRERDAALRGAVELRQHDAGDVDRLGEQLRLAQAVLTSGRVDREEDLVGRV